MATLSVEFCSEALRAEAARLRGGAEAGVQFAGPTRDELLARSVENVAAAIESQVAQEASHATVA